MSQRYSLVCDDRLAAEVDAIAREYELTETEVLHQLVTIGLERRETAAR
ncbi:hypothetical protein HAPAU_12650 [Halalkalicoccus paucihalophilus]|jgi:hypothetical protein|uniref:CopG family transcriptional regulator n=1 Tax=Halalkalicoccus paucihalophilus TaxID=1008153 RepID=A0A151AET3_9EURY|nr:CopG family transcriptional regulator [Halalkalicoccus paucihalophilus]KYH26171.1 hypothetical protein HAPAU_12650 [Halalkalicoccus paucihalophilus]MCL7418142.1 CopG family transcriptional regulator [Halalkalicoccus sp.]